MGVSERFELLEGFGVADPLAFEPLDLIFHFRKLAYMGPAESIVFFAKRAKRSIRAPVFPERDFLLGERGRVGAADHLELGLLLGEGGVVPTARGAEHGFLFGERVAQAVYLRLLAVEQRSVARGLAARLLEGLGDGAEPVVPHGQLRLVLGLEYARDLRNDGLARFLPGVLRARRGRGHGGDVIHGVAEPAVLLGD